MKSKKKVAGLFLIIIGATLIGYYLHLIHKARESQDVAEEVFNDVIVDEDEDYIYVDKDFLSTLQEAFSNKDVIGYIVYEDAGISYPIVHSKDNQEYLHLDLHKGYSAFGTIFLDKTCDDDFSNVNSVIYGHHMRDGSMFGRLETTVNEKGVDGQVFYVYTRDCRKEYKAISAEVIADTDENASKLLVSTRKDFLTWLKGISHDYTYNEEEGNFTTLISCHYSGLRVDRFGLTGVEVKEKEYKVREDNR